MSLDQYSFCPCGNGKKIKFCKCNEHFQEMQTIHRMIVGEQNVAALDRINSNLKTLPSEPWLLAMKCELLLQLSEVESLEETSAKFIRLQPDNPLAKLYRSLVAVVRGNTEEATALMLQAIADSTEALPPLTATVAINLIEVMGQRGMFLSALLHSEMLMDMGEGMQQVAAGAFESIIAQPKASILQRESLPSPEDAQDQPYAERISEVEALLASYRIINAKTKLESMLREFGNQPAILQQLLYCQLMLTDTDSAGAIAKKIAQCSSLPEHQRIYYQALAYELAPRSLGIAIIEELCQYEIDDPDFEKQLIENKHLLATSIEQFKGLLRALLPNEEVPPKVAYVTIEPVLTEQFGELEAKRVGSWIAYFGKQTDKPARLISLEPQPGQRRQLLEVVKQELGLNALKRELLEALPTTYVSDVSSTVVLKNQVPPERRTALNEATRQLVMDAFLDCSFEVLGRQSPRMAASNPDNRIPLAALVLHWQASGASSLQDHQFKELLHSLQLQPTKLSSTQDVFDSVGGASYFWMDLSEIDAKSLIQLMQSALMRGVFSIFDNLVQRSEQMQWPEELALSARYTVLNLKVRTTDDPVLAESQLKEIVDAGKQLGVPVGNAILERVDALNTLGRSGEARQYLEAALRENPNDPILLQFIQTAMMRQQQAMRARGVPAGQPPVSPSSGPANSIWTPGQSTDSPAESSPAGSSKLWIPGQD